MPQAVTLKQREARTMHFEVYLVCLGYYAPCSFFH